MSNVHVPLALVRGTKKWTDVQQDRRDGLVEHLWRYCFACVAYHLRINGAWVMHIPRIWFINGDATAYDVAYENLTIAYPWREWHMHSVHPTYALRSTRFYGIWWVYVQRMGCVHAEPKKYTLYLWAVNVTFKWPCNARGICLAHLGDSTTYVWRTHNVNEDPWVYVAYLPCICYFLCVLC